jgi:hypothetical protein
MVSKNLQTNLAPHLGNTCIPQPIARLLRRTVLPIEANGDKDSTIL